jgi:putative phage-type endonuclease
MDDDERAAIRHLLKDKDKYEQRSPAWYAVREKLGVTGSEAAGVLGINPPCFKDSQPEQIMLRKLGLIEGFKGNEYTAHGQKYEDEAIERYCALTGKKVELFGLLLHPEHDFLGASPDGITYDGIAIEVKVRYLRPQRLTGVHVTPDSR